MGAETLLPMAEADFPWLTLLLLLLPVGAMLTLLQPVREARWAALTTALTALLISLMIVAGFDSTQSGFQFVERSAWMPGLNIDYLIGVDGLSVLFLPFTALLFVGVIIASWNAMRTMPPLFFALLLVLEGMLLGIFTALNTMLFMLFWELSLLPLYFLISLWGAGPNRRYAAGKYTLFMLAGGLPLLLGFVVLAVQYPAGMSFDYAELLSMSHAYALQSVVFFLLLIGVAVKIPLVPFHSWLPVVAQEGPASVISLLVGVKVGVYALLRFVLPLAPQAALEYQWLLIGAGMLGVLYGAVAALSQSNLRAVLAFSSLSHVGLVVLGVVSFNQQGMQGAILQLLNFTVVSGGLFILLGYLHQRTGSCDLLSLGGLSERMPFMAAFFFVLGMASIGIPGTSGFPAEFLLIVGVLQSHPGAGLLVLFSVILTAAYFLSAYRKAFFGVARNADVAKSPDLKRRERLVVLVFVLVVLVFGFYPQPLLDVIAGAAESWLEHFHSAL
ncbi:MAG: NADH-quinone oxidoreductase subunit M [Thiolinea sp.]